MSNESSKVKNGLSAKHGIGGIGALSGLAVTLAAALGMTVMSQGCTVTSSDTPLDGGLFTGDDSGGGGGATTDGSTAISCNQCLFQQCTGQWSLCTASAECMAIYTCATAPGGNVNTCFTMHPTAQAQYLALAKCDQAGECNGTCAASCAKPVSCPDAGAPGIDAAAPPVDAGGMDTDAATDAAMDIDGATATDAGTPDLDAAAPVDSGMTTAADCPTCTAMSCGTAKTACDPGTPCDQYTQCLAACQTTPCVDMCGTTFPMGQTASATLSTCVLMNCAMPCGASQ